MFITIITDCKDQNAFGRQMTRTASLFGFPAVPIGVDSDIEAAGNLLDALDASEGRDGLIITNVAPRHGKAKKWPNGTPFGYFHFNKTLIVSTIDAYTLSLIKKFKITDKIKVWDIPTVMEHVQKDHHYQGQSEYIKKTQFRSFEFAPRVAKWVYKGTEWTTTPTNDMDISEIPDLPGCVWWVDSFGNVKTTILPQDIGFEADKLVELKNVGKVKCYNRLKDVPNGELGLVIGSSGFLGDRFLEIVIQGSNAYKQLGLKTGTILL